MIRRDFAANRLPPGIYVDAPGDEVIETFPCFGGQCSVHVLGGGPAGTARNAALRAKRSLRDWQDQFSRFVPDSELSRLNRDPHETVAVSHGMARFIESALIAAERTGGLVDPTLLAELERAGYSEHFDRVGVPLERSLTLAPPRAAGGHSPSARWRNIRLDRAAGTVTRPVGVQLDTGGVVKGMFCDLLAEDLAGHESFALIAAGDVRIGGGEGLLRPIRVASPFDASVLHVFELVLGAAATSGIGRRSWLDADGRPAHHLLDPATGRPAFTGIVQVTALAPSALEAEWLSKAALLSGPAAALDWLTHGGVVVYDDGTFEVVEAASWR
jgi:thiamine biosynthesis lipoprotein